MALSVKGDVLARLGRWNDSLEAFSGAAAAAGRADQPDRARHLSLGPLYLMAEGLGRYGVCGRALRGNGTELARALRQRLSRLTGKATQPTPGPSVAPETGHLPGLILLLESCWRGRTNPGELLDVISDWPRTEREWRWRCIAEGAAIASSAGHSLRKWVKLARGFGEAVPDPRYEEERAWLLSRR